MAMYDILTHEIMQHMTYVEHYPVLLSCKVLYNFDRYMEYYYNAQNEKYTIDYAARYGHLKVVRWLSANRNEGCTINAMNWAARNGHLDVVRWLSANRNEGCTTDAMNIAASEGYLDIVRWLSANRNEGCTINAMNWAIANEHLEIVQWLSCNNFDIS